MKSRRPPTKAEKSNAWLVAAVIEPLLLTSTSISPPVAFVSSITNAALVKADMVPLLTTAISTFSAAELLPISRRSIAPALSIKEDGEVLLSVVREPMIEPVFKSRSRYAVPDKSIEPTSPVLVKKTPSVILVASNSETEAELDMVIFSAPAKSMISMVPERVKLESLTPAKPIVPMVTDVYPTVLSSLSPTVADDVTVKSDAPSKSISSICPARFSTASLIAFAPPKLSKPSISTLLFNVKIMFDWPTWAAMLPLT